MIESLKQGGLELTYDSGSGSYGIVDNSAERTVFQGAVAGIGLARGKRKVFSSDASKIEVKKEETGITATHHFDGFPIVMELRISGIESEGCDGFAIDLRVINEGDWSVDEIDFYPLVLERGSGGQLFGRGGGREYSFLRNGLLTWSWTGTKRGNERLCGPRVGFVHDMAENPTVRFPPARGHFIGECFGAARDTDGSVLVAGFSSMREQLSQVSFKSRDGFFHHLRAVCHAEGNAVASGRSLDSEELVVFPRMARKGENTALLFDAPLKACAARAAAKTPPQRMPGNPIGWCSWYYYFHDMTEKVILKNLEAAKKLRDHLPVKIFQVDDGYQPAPGDWLDTTKKFPRGMAWMAERIREAGFTPGIWLAPFMATGRSRLFAEHPDWFVANPGGRPRWTTLWTSPYAFGSVYCLDTTHPEALEWLRSVFNTVVHEWGYEYLKLDFLYAGAIDGKRFDPGATRAQAFRRGLSAIREAAGDETYILGCGTPLGPAAGLVNGARIAGDTAPKWDETLVSEVIGHRAGPGVANAARSMFARYFLHRRWFIADPDCLMSRFRDTKLNGAEVLTHAACVAMAGGALFISDNLAELEPPDIALAQKLIPPADTPAVPADLFDSDIASTLVMSFGGAGGRWAVVARFNWDAHTADLPVYFDRAGLDPETEYHVYDLWEDRYYGRKKGMITLPRVPGHGSRMLSLRPALDTPHVVSTTFHFTQGGIDIRSQAFDKTKNCLKIEMSLPGRRSGRIYLCIPRGFVAQRALINRTHETIPERERNDFYYLEFEMNGEAEVEVQFRTE